MKNIHVLTPFSRHDLLRNLLDGYGPMNVILHLLTFRDEPSVVCNEKWVRPFVASIDKKGTFGIALFNAFIMDADIIDDDYYVMASDDDMYEPSVFEKIREMDAPIIIISMKRGYQIPREVHPLRAYPITTLYAKPENMRVGKIGGEQIILKGSVLKTIWLDEERAEISDGLLAIALKDKYPIHYEPDLFALFNFYEPGRWGKKDIAFGVMVNDKMRLDMVLRQSEIQGDMHFIQNPESATKGLNKLLGMIEATGAEVAVLCHQDMYFRQGWISLVKEQLAKLPESWVVAGVIGKDMQGRICGQFHDMRIPADFNTKHIHEFPQPACCFDEAVIIVNLKKGFRFDEAMDGFDLYGTLAVLQVWEMGGSAFIIDAFCEHYCLRPFTWFPDEKFCKNYKWLYNKFNEIYRLDSTALGFSEETKIFKTSASPFEEEKAA